MLYGCVEFEQVDSIDFRAPADVSRLEPLASSTSSADISFFICFLFFIRKTWNRNLHLVLAHFEAFFQYST